MATDGPTPSPCDSEIFKKGEPAVLLGGSSNAVERWVRSLVETTAARLDWHYSGGVAQVLHLGDDASWARVQAEIRARAPSMMIDDPLRAPNPYICQLIEQRVDRGRFRNFSDEPHGTNEHGSDEPVGVITALVLKQAAQRPDDVVDECPPARISRREIRLDLTGYLMPVDVDGQPVLLAMPGTDDRFITVFSAKEKLDAVFTDYGIGYVRLKRIEHGPTFLASLAENELSFRLRVAVDPYKHENGRLRYTEIPL